MEQQITFWPFIVFAAIVVALAAVMIGLSHVLGERHSEKKTGEPYESGIPPTGDARLRFSSAFYIIAMFFVIFDLDAAFIMLWAISFRELGLAGYIGVFIFIVLLIILLVYELRIGALDFGPDGKKILKNIPRPQKDTK
ncbi:MAG TPA: NADH-quinone oxidoreductase subunit A [Bacteroidales bacterium]|nr:NADH-quinone oxidoreductase subunit A [Bacteroidales bacterium]HPV16807.1 NADH-quinone oxidoreductase subunit A [Bacteroidales bacterium]HQG76937.1 NADH-quinone oxidoreductase subunit A [Bacteroidales bacterium]